LTNVRMSDAALQRSS